MMIAIMDSGIGGFDLLNKIGIQNVNTNAQLFYYADSANFPYGNKTKEQIQHAIKNAFEIFEQKQVKTAVLACNTASVIYHTMRTANLQVIDLYSEIMHYANDPEITIICTELTKTILNGKFAGEIIALPELANLIESMQIENATSYVKSQLKNKRIVKLLYACTHYPLIHEKFKEICPNAEIINPIINIAKTLNISQVNIEFNSIEMQQKYEFFRQLNVIN